MCSATSVFGVFVGEYIVMTHDEEFSSVYRVYDHLVVLVGFRHLNGNLKFYEYYIGVMSS